MRASRLCSRTPASRASSTYYGIVGVVALFAILPGSVFAGKSDFPPLLASFTPESQCVDNVIFMDELLCSMPAPRNGALNPCAAACKLLRGAPDGICVRRPRCNKKIRIFGEPSVAAGGTRATRVARSPKKGKGKGCKKRSPRSASENYDYETCEIYDDEYSGECVVGSSEEYSGEYVEGNSESAENSGECVEGSDSDSGERSGSLETGTTAKPPVKPTSNPPAKPSAQPPVKPSPNPPMKPTPNPPAKPSAQPPVKPGKPGCGVGDGNANLPGGGNRKGKGEENGNENLAGHRSGESFSYGDSYSEGDSGSDTEERVIRAPYMCMCLCPP